MQLGQPMPASLKSSPLKLPAAVLGGVQGSLDDIIEAKNQSVRQLQQELEGMIAAHQDLVQASEEKMAEYGVPMEELGFVPQSLGVTAAEG